jgi:hypothetical protein
MKLKYIIRRLVLGALLTPVIAGIYWFGYAALVGLGATPTTTSSGAYQNGLEFGFAITIVFAFYEKLMGYVAPEEDEED